MIFKNAKKILVLVSIIFFSCTGNRNSVEELQFVEKPKHFFWKVSDENSSVWILGSIHFADSSFYPLDSIIENVFDSVETIAVEININDDSVNADVMKHRMQQGLLPAGKSLQQFLPLETWILFDSICTAWNLPIANFQIMKPWLAAMSISSFAIQRAGINPNLGIDVVLLDKAASQGKVIVGLEAAGEQIGALADLDDSDSTEIYYLQTTLYEILKLDSIVARIVRAWKTGDDELLRQTMNEEDDICEECKMAMAKKLNKKIEENVYTKRNTKMVEKIMEFLALDNEVFVVLGVAHLVLDKDNIIERLRYHGFDVHRF